VAEAVYLVGVTEPAAPATPPPTAPGGIVLTKQALIAGIAVLAVVAVLGVAGLVSGALAWADRADRENVERLSSGAAVRNRVSDFLTDIQERDFSRAYGQLCKSAKRKGNRAFVDAVSVNRLDSFRIVRSDADALPGLTSAGVEAELSWIDDGDTTVGRTEPVEMFLRLEDGEWRVCQGPF
jgi:hypothetical protein